MRRASPGRIVGLVIASATLALSAPALARNTPPAARPAGTSAAADPTGCDPDGLHAGFVVDPATAEVEAVVVEGVRPGCEGHLVEVVVAGVPGSAAATSPRTTVPLEQPIAAADVDRITVTLADDAP